MQSTRDCTKTNYKIVVQTLFQPFKEQVTPDKETVQSDFLFLLVSQSAGQYLPSLNDMTHLKAEHNF